jgi:hypothetical protein
MLIVQLSEGFLDTGRRRRHPETQYVAIESGG